MNRWFRLHFFKQSFESKINALFLFNIVISCCFIHDQFIMKSKDFNAVIKHQNSFTCSFNWNLICVMWMMLKIVAFSVNRKRIDLMNAIVKNWWYLTKFVLTKFKIDVSIFVIKKILWASLEVCTWQSNCNCWFLNSNSFTSLKCNDDILTITKCETTFFF